VPLVPERSRPPAGHRPAYRLSDTCGNVAAGRRGSPPAHSGDSQMPGRCAPRKAVRARCGTQCCCISLNPKEVLAFRSRAVAYANKEQYDRAIQDLT
jgi:hypothetical protein